MSRSSQAHYFLVETGDSMEEMVPGLSALSSGASQGTLHCWLRVGTCLLLIAPRHGGKQFRTTQAGD